MTLLKIKAKIYQYTGIYLAKKEEDKHVESVGGDKFGLKRGIWQCNHGFTRYAIVNTKFYPPRSFKRKLQKFYHSILAACKQFKSDFL